MAKLLGKVNLLGLNAFGNNPGMDALFGAAIGGGVSTVATLACEHSGSDKAITHSDAIGFGFGIASAAALYAKKSTRHAAFGAALGAFLASGLPWIKRSLAPTKSAAAVAAVTAVVTNPAAAAADFKGLGLHQIQNLQGHQLRQLNGHTIESVPRPAGLAGTMKPPVSLYGQQTSAMRSLSLSGGPGVSGLAASYGATLFGGGK
jgi:hypothetical protein